MEGRRDWREESGGAYFGTHTRWQVAERERKYFVNNARRHDTAAKQKWASHDPSSPDENMCVEIFVWRKSQRH
jgi:hypothetical protein